MNTLSSGFLMILLGVWIFTRTWWGALPHKIAAAVT